MVDNKRLLETASNTKLTLNKNYVAYWLGNSEDSNINTQLVNGETKHTKKSVYKSKIRSSHGNPPVFEE